MSDLKAIFDTIRTEAAAEAEEQFSALVAKLPRLPMEKGDYFGAGPSYTQEQRETFIQNYVASAIGRLSRHLTNVALGRPGTA